ncbi:hypothetical protein GH741_17980 [Aquibacillus halophilus]|uniref:Holin n=1 Tax=Aquibacillus halophilus TaxID=930132 RepID=A0A6A8DNB9_9BACI|nr:hypothetical protein [Aquibacillus halophilus]MRH44537.1 hypothetical protein [Aquibacillus halophilus]
MIDVNQLDPAHLATISAIVAALVTVLGNAFKLQTRYRSLLAIGIAFVLVFIPSFLLNKVLTALIIGLTASGVYSQVKPLKMLNNIEKLNNGKNSKKTNETLDSNLNSKTTNTKIPVSKDNRSSNDKISATNTYKG